MNIKKVFAVLLLTFFSVKSYCQKEIKAEEAKNNAGDTVRVCTKIFDTRYEENTKGNPTFLYAGADTSNAPLTFIIWGDKRKFFDYKPEKDLKERVICVTGKIELLKDKPVIIIEKQSQIDIK